MFNQIYILQTDINLIKHSFLIYQARKCDG